MLIIDFILSLLPVHENLLLTIVTAIISILLKNKFSGGKQRFTAKEIVSILEKTSELGYTHINLSDMKFEKK